MKTKLAGVLVLLLVSAARGEEAGFTIEQQRSGDVVGYQYLWWTITNQREEVLVVNSVTINSEYKCPAGFWNIEFALMSEKAKFPAKLTIGDSTYAMQYDPRRQYIAKSYPKKPIFIDVNTNRGVFRFDLK
jgi:hypothetical protein